jgi:hypothetical protein
MPVLVAISCGDMTSPDCSRAVRISLRVVHDAPDDFAVAISHIVVIFIPIVGAAAFAGRNKNKLIQRTRHIARVLSFTDASEHENCRPLLRPEGHVALVYKADRASGIERVGIENLLILFATRAAGRLIARRGDDPNRPSVAAAGTGRTRRTSGARRTRTQPGERRLRSPRAGDA